MTTFIEGEVRALAQMDTIDVSDVEAVGILKSLGAPSGGVMSIFLSYGVSLGAVGSGVGIIAGSAAMADS